jgi:hypothetical protein
VSQLELEWWWWWRERGEGSAAAETTIAGDGAGFEDLKELWVE